MRIPLLNALLLLTFKTKSRPLELWGLPFKNPLGLAAGFDKDGKYMHLMAHLGFGFIEIGTVTPLPQEGNPRPRLFRLPKDHALINRMGFNNEGLEAFVKRLKSKPKGLIIGANIGKNKDTPNHLAVTDYVRCFEALHPYADYFVINVSSPNTPGLRELQNREPLLEIINALQSINQSLDHPRPLLLKIAPDITQEQLNDIAEISVGLDGIIATNTTVDRKNLKTPLNTLEQYGSGGLSGVPLRSPSTEIISKLRARLPKDKVIIGVGGIADVASTRQKLEAGAQLVQVYSGLIYEGPWMVKRILSGL